MKREDFNVGLILKRIPDDGWRGCVVAVNILDCGRLTGPKLVAVALQNKGGGLAVHLLGNIVEDLVLDPEALEVDRDWHPDAK